MEENIIVTNVRAAVPAGFTPVYVGRTMPGREGSVFGNPLPLAGKRWTEEARHWSDVLARHPDARVRQVAEQALGARGYRQGDAAQLYRLVLREQVRRGDVQLSALLDLSERLRRGERLALQCWCAPKPCHALVVRDAVLGYARR